MKQFQTFTFDSYGFDEAQRTIELNYCLDNQVDFTETLILPKEPKPKVVDHEALDRALNALHLIGGMSYYKTCCPKEIEVRTGTLSKEQAEFWDTVYTKGLGEFFYKNQIDFRGLINFPSSVTKPVTIDPRPATGRSLVPIGGGKDSIVTIQKLKSEGKDITLFRIGQHPLIKTLVKEIDLPCIIVERHLSKTLFEMNAQGALNGHVPITAYVSMLAIVLAEIYGFDEVVMSDEKSADIGNVNYLDMEINHQWSKSDEAETMIRTYTQDFIDPNVAYANPLRTMTELEVVEEFVKYPTYFRLFTSCNKNWKIVKDAKSKVQDASRWCGKCPKCAFVFALCAAYLPKNVLVEIFGSDFYEDETLIPLYKQLLGAEGFKPFECVGTPEETKEAFDRAHKRGDLDDTAVMKMYLAS